jgi:hypothetical protein
MKVVENPHKNLTLKKGVFNEGKEKHDVKCYFANDNRFTSSGPFWDGDSFGFDGDARGKPNG